MDTYSENTPLFKRFINEKSISKFKILVSKVNWNDVNQINSPNEAYNSFIQKFLIVYEEAFPKVKTKIKIKSLLSPWITRGLLKSSKKKQKLYDKFLKNKTYSNEMNYKTYKNLFETLKFKSKKNYYAKLITKYKNDSKKTWQVINEIIGKTKLKSSNLPRRIIVDNIETYDKKIISEKFNNYFINVGPTLAERIPPSENNFKSYLKENNLYQQEYNLSDDELEKAFFSLKINKSPGHDEINFNAVKQVFHNIQKPLKHIFSLSLSKEIFPDELKIAKVTPIFKTGERSSVSNYRPISVLPCFSKILEKIMYNRLYQYLIRNNLLYNKQFGFQKANSTEHAIIELVDQLCASFNKNNFTVGIFIDLSKAFDTVDHKILLEKLSHYGIKGKNLTWFKSYLSKRKQFIMINETEKSKTLEIKCGVPQGSILGPLLFLLYVNDLSQASTLLEPIMFADDTNLFYSHQNINTVFNTANKELEKINKWFEANKLSLNTDKTKIHFLS